MLISNVLLGLSGTLLGATLGLAIDTVTALPLAFSSPSSEADLHTYVGPLDSRREDHAISTDKIGGNHGKPFSDKDYAHQRHRRIAEISLSGCGKGQRLTEVTIGWRNNHAESESADIYTTHGVAIAGQLRNTLKLAKDEYITDVYLSTYQKKIGTTVFATHHTRIGYARFITNKSNSVQCGGDPKRDNTYWWRQTDPRMVLLYLSGSSGDAVDSLTGHFIPLQDF